LGVGMWLSTASMSFMIASLPSSGLLPSNAWSADPCMRQQDAAVSLLARQHLLRCILQFISSQPDARVSLLVRQQPISVNPRTATSE
jgi:hypothetical protein